MAKVWPRLVACPQTRRLSKKRVPCGDLKAVGWKPDRPPDYYVCTHCLTRWPLNHVESLIKARDRVAPTIKPEPYAAPELPGFEGEG